MKNTTRLLALLLTLLLPCTLLAQQVPQPELHQLATTGTVTTTGTTALPPGAVAPSANPKSPIQNPKSDDDVHVMDVFNVDGSTNEDGYMAFDTTSGSLIRTPLRDTPASISPFTSEFLNDVGAASIEELLTFAGNMEVDPGDGRSDFNDNDSLNADGSNNNFRIRGITGGVSFDFVQSGVPQDLYNVDTAEMSSGANSILYGLGAQGGMLTLSSRRANLQRNTSTVTGIIGTWDHPGKAWNFQRLTLNYNVVLIPRKWAFRLQGVLQDGGTGSWRYGITHRQKRLNPVMTIKPWKTATLTLQYEKGRLTQSAVRNSVGIATDGASGWLYWRDQEAAAGNPNPGLLQGFGSGYVPSPFTLVNPNNGTIYNMNPVGQIGDASTPNFVYVNNNDTLYDYRLAYQSRSIYPGAPTGYANQDIASYYYSTQGPNSLRVQNFQRWSATIEQRIGRFNFQFAYNHNKTVSTVHAPNSNSSDYTILRADPNTVVSSEIWGGSSPERLVPGPNPGGLYIEDVWMYSHATQTNDSYRLLAETGFNLKKFGRHRFVTLLEHNEQERLGGNKREILVDQDQVAITDPLSLNSAGNWIRRRHYVTPGDYRTYHSGNWEPMITDLVIGNRTFHSHYAATGLQNAHVKRKTDTASLTLQSYWFRDRLRTTFGTRFDTYDYGKERVNRITELDDPRLLDKTKCFHEWAHNGLWNKRRYNAFTYSAGGVFRFTNWLDGVVNYSTNRGEPSLDGRTILPYGTTPELSRGTNAEFGVRINLSRTGNWHLRITRFETKQLGNASATPDGTTVDISPMLGADRLFNIFDALYFLRPTTQTALPPISGWPDGTGPGMGPMSAEQYAVTPPDPARYPYGAPPLYNAGTVNTRSQGYEIELNARPFRNVELRLAYSYTHREKINLFPEIFDYYNKNIPIWLDLANPATHPNPNSTDDTNEYHVSGVSGNPTLNEYIRNQLWGAAGTGGIRSGLNEMLYRLSGSYGSRPHKVNATVRYRFQNGSLKGLSIGGSVHYQSPNIMPDPKDPGYQQAFTKPPEGTTDLVLDPQLYFGKRGMINGRSTFSNSMFAGYRCKLFGGRTTMTLRLNINNIFNQSVIREGRRNADGYVTRVYISPPRTIRLTSTFEF